MSRHAHDSNRPAQHRERRKHEARAKQRLEHVTLAQLAKLRGVTPDSLRQRIHRGTLRATKAGTVWLVPLDEARRVVRERGDEPSFDGLQP